MLKVNATKEYAVLINKNTDGRYEPVSVLKEQGLKRCIFDDTPYHMVEGCLPCFDNWWIRDYCDY